MTSLSIDTLRGSGPRRRVIPQTIAVLLLSSLSAGAAAQVLILTGNNEKFTVFIDPTTVRKKGSLVSMTSVFDYQQPQEGGPDNKKYLSTRRHFEYDCKQPRAHGISVSSYADHLGKGEPLATINLNGSWAVIAEGSADDTLWNYACDKKADGPGAPKRR